MSERLYAEPVVAWSPSQPVTRPVVASGLSCVIADSESLAPEKRRLESVARKVSDRLANESDLALRGGNGHSARGGKPNFAHRVPMGAYRTILADPPWQFKTWSEKGGNFSPERHYPTLDDRALYDLPVAEIAAPESTLLMWATVPKLPEACSCIQAWGFTYKSAIAWVKMSRASAPRIGLGYHARNIVELLLIAQRGSPGAPPPSDRPDGLMFCPIGRHSAKPEFQYDIAENYPGPYLEMFHRPRGGMFGPREGWTFIGNEVDGLDIRDALARLIAAAPACAEDGAESAERSE